MRSFPFYSLSVCLLLILSCPAPAQEAGPEKDSRSYVVVDGYFGGYHRPPERFPGDPLAKSKMMLRVLGEPYKTKSYELANDFMGYRFVADAVEPISKTDAAGRRPLGKDWVIWLAIDRNGKRVHKVLADERVLWPDIWRSDSLPWIHPNFLQVGLVGTYGYSFRIIQVIDANNMIAIASGGGQTVWLKDFDTKGRVDNELMKYDRLVSISGTKQYTTTLGATKTILVIEPASDKQQEATGDPIKSGAKAASDRRAELLARAEKEFARLYAPRTKKSDADVEQAAASKLKLIRRLLADGKKDAARTRLTELMNQYPDTAAAAEAKKLLEEGR